MLFLDDSSMEKREEKKTKDLPTHPPTSQSISLLCAHFLSSTSTTTTGPVRPEGTGGRHGYDDDRERSRDEAGEGRERDGFSGCIEGRGDNDGGRGDGGGSDGGGSERDKRGKPFSSVFLRRDKGQAGAKAQRGRTWRVGTGSASDAEEGGRGQGFAVGEAGERQSC